MAAVRLDLGQRRLVAPLFAGWDKSLPAAYLQGHMGYALADDVEAPASAQIVVGDFCFFAGRPDYEIAACAAASIMVARTKAWDSMLASVWAGRAERHTRYAVQHVRSGFHIAKLRSLTVLPAGFSLCRIDAALCEILLQENWSRDLCALFGGGADFFGAGWVSPFCTGENRLRARRPIRCMTTASRLRSIRRPPIAAAVWRRPAGRDLCWNASTAA